MPGKLQNVQELMEERVSALWKNPEDYVSFLETASRLYKYSFKDQILIHAQRPDAVACAEYDTWGREDITNRYVKRGSKGIALIKEENGRAKLRYVFDFADTAAKDERSRTPFFWKVTDENEDAVIKRLSPAADYLGEAVRVKTDELVKLHSEEYLTGLLEEKDNTFLAGLDDMSIRFRFEDLLKTSVSYTVLTRCGYDAEALTDLEELRGLYEFNSIKAMTVLGDAVSTISEQILRNIEQTLRIELIKNNEQGLGSESSEKNEHELETERSKNNEHSITENHDRERDSVPSGRSDADISSGLGDGGTERNRQVRTSQENVSEGKEELGVSGDADRRNSELTSGGDRRNGKEETRTPASADDEESRSDGRAESERSDGLDRNSKQPESSDRGTDLSRTDIRLKDNTEHEAVSEDNSDAAFSVSGDISAADEFFEIEPETEETGGYAGQEQLSLFSGMENFYGMMEEISDLARDDDYSDLVGEYIEYDGGRYKVTDFKDDIGGKRLELQDMDNTDWFPIFRTVPLEELYENGYRYLDRKDFEEKISLQETPSEAIDKADKPETAGTSDKAGIAGEKHDFRITDEDLGTGGAKTKYKANVEAIKLLNTIEAENRYASPEEQEVLSKYVGWGGMPQAFDANNSSWSAEYNELRSLLSPEEYENAKASTLTAFYTSPAVISAVYEGLANLGFKEGNVLEPAMGVGNFFGMIPDEMRNSRLYGVELDSISGKIAKQLYQTADIQITGFEKTQFPDNFFDVAVGNVPFGQFKLSEKRYDKLNLNIHDHFFAKSLDKVRAGGVIVFVTSKGTLDKANPNFRKYLAQRAELIGAIRLPNNAFKENAGTEVTSDIIFLQKRDKMLDIEPDWVHLGATADGVPVSRYFEEHPEMILGEMKQGMEFSMYGNAEETACVPVEGADLKEQLKEAVRNIQGNIPEAIRDESEKAEKSIPADPDVKNFSYTVIDDNIYYRENSRMFLKEDLPKATSDRIKGMMELRNCVRTLIDYQLNEYSDADIRDQQRKLNDLYDSFTKKYGLINSRGNANAFSDDSSYYLLSSLEVLDENGELERKADMFTKRTIKQKAEIHSVDTASEALAVSISEKAAVDMPFMEELTGKKEEELYNDLKGVIFLNPLYNTEDGVTGKYLPADEYLSGNIREKLEIAKHTAELSPEDYSINVEALTNAMPKPLEASEIDVRLGATWIDTDIIKQFISETLQVPRYMQRMFDVHFSKFTSEWQIEGKNNDRSNVMANVTFGTGKKNAYSIIEDTLNLRDTRVYDRVEQPNGKITSVLNKKETMIAQEKQEAIKNAFRDWIFKDPDRREKLVNRYNTLFNSSRPREYDGSHITFSGMTPEIKLRPHQLNAIAHVMYGGNTLLAHQVGAGKSFEMIASAMESKRLGLCTKSLFVVPNHLTEQMGAEFLRLYPAANILVATKKDFEAKNRKKLCSKIATGDYDAVIIGHSQLEKIPVSAERQERIIRKQINEITDGIEELSRRRGDSFSIKQLEKTKKNLEAKLDKLTSMERDDVVTFEELGIDKMFVDEAHSFKNLFLYTKMRNVAGIQQTEAQKSSDLYMKCQYLDELTGGKGCTFATGTPVSNSMTELYTMMRYLQADKLKEMGMNNFDAWAANFGEAVTAIELAPEGTGYRAKTRFSKFFNLPELINVFKECADIKTADMLNLPVPEAEFHNVVVKPSDIQKEMVEGLSERAKLIHDKAVAPEVDNMLKVTNDGRKIGLDQRLIDPLLPDTPDSKVNACVSNVLDIYHKHDDTKATQIIFCDFSTPKNDGSFNLYDDIRNKLVEKGVPKEEVVFIHEADSEAKKKELFSKIRKGQVRVLIGSTAKCGAGTNIQDKLIALHHLDCPWRPSDLAQREGRIIRQGNENSKVEVFRYMTESTFDAYLYVQHEVA
ncbi:MAG: DEAD/DEAH box helicase family protein [Oscillospiraceae bacterium]|nr:DEAD/DEAH box helicase family protein [Oscillospiraceae bacterium]